MTGTKQDLRSRYGRASIDEWQAAMRAATETDDTGFPKFTHLPRLGSANLRSGIDEAFALYRIVRPHLDGNVGEGKKYLDFGCGVGRILRTFIRDFSPGGMTGLDVTEEFVEICERDFGPEFTFRHIATRPPCPLPDGSVDAITAYSVFSHFSAIQATRWLDEFNRIARPGAIIALTTYGRGHLEYVCTAEPGLLPPNKIIQRKDIDDAGGKSEFLRMFDLGEMLFYTRNNSFGMHDYGHAYVGEEFVRRIWGRHFEILEIVDDYRRLEQMAVVMRKPL